MRCFGVRGWRKKLRHPIMSLGIPIDIKVQYYMQILKHTRLALVDSCNEPKCLTVRCLCANQRTSPMTGQSYGTTQVHVYVIDQITLTDKIRRNDEIRTCDEQTAST